MGSVVSEDGNVIYSCKSLEVCVMYCALYAQRELHFAWTFRHSNAWVGGGGEGHEILQLLYRCSLKSLQKQSSCLLCSYFRTSTNSWLGFEFQDVSSSCQQAVLMAMCSLALLLPLHSSHSIHFEYMLAGIMAALEMWGMLPIINRVKGWNPKW